MSVKPTRRNAKETRSKELSRILPEGTQVEKLATGFKFTEGPVWNYEGGYLLFSDIPANQIKKWSPTRGVDTFREQSGNSNGLTYDKQGQLIACEHGNRRVSRTESDGTITTLVEHYLGRRLNSPNDVVVKSDGSIYFTDPPYGIETGQQEIPFQGVYRLFPDSGKLMVLEKDFNRPNGLAFSPDEKLLYIGDSSKRRHVRAFEVKEDGTLGKGSLFSEIESEEPGPPDGMKMDIEGRLYVAAAEGIWIFAPTGELLGLIRVPETPANCAWGDSNWQSLYITARTSLYRVKLTVQGIRVP